MRYGFLGLGVREALLGEREEGRERGDDTIALTSHENMAMRPGQIELESGPGGILQVKSWGYWQGSRYMYWDIEGDTYLSSYSAFVWELNSQRQGRNTELRLIVTTHQKVFFILFLYCLFLVAQKEKATR